MTRVWVKLDATYVEDEKVMAAGAMAELVFIRSIAYCRRRVTDGFVSASAVRVLTIGIPDAAEKLVESLVTNGLWDVADGGWRVRNYEVWQQTKAGLAADAERKRAEREMRKKERKKERDIGGTSEVRPSDVRPFTVAPPVGLREHLRRHA